MPLCTGFLPFRRAVPCAAALVAALGFSAQAQTSDPAASRIDKVTLYQGSATVERTLRVPAGAREAQFFCLPAALDTQGLQVSGDAGLRIGELRVQTLERALASACASPLDATIRSLQDDLANVAAAASALKLVDSYLHTVAGNAPANLAFAGQPGTVLWQQTLAGNASASFAAEHVLSYPKDAPLNERR